MDREDVRVDMPDLTQSVDAIRRRYLSLRGLRADLDEFSTAERLPTAPLPSWLVASCLRFDTTAPTSNRPALEAFLQQQAGALVEQLSDERESHWDHQGRMLRYTLIMLQNRVQTLRADLERAEHPSDRATDPGALLQRLEDQVDSLRRTIEHWQDGRLVRQPCSLAQIAAFVEDPHHPGDKEHLDRILQRGDEARLTWDQVCIELAWDRISGRIESAALIPADRQRAA
jgi:hypothetical protein